MGQKNYKDKRSTFLWQIRMTAARHAHAIASLKCQRIYICYHLQVHPHQLFHLLMISNQVNYGIPLIQDVLCC